MAEVREGGVDKCRREVMFTGWRRYERAVLTNVGGRLSLLGGRGTVRYEKAVFTGWQMNESGADRYKIVSN